MDERSDVVVSCHRIWPVRAWLKHQSAQKGRHGAPPAERGAQAVGARPDRHLVREEQPMELGLPIRSQPNQEVSPKEVRSFGDGGIADDLRWLPWTNGEFGLLGKRFGVVTIVPNSAMPVSFNEVMFMMFGVGDGGQQRSMSELIRLMRKLPARCSPCCTIVWICMCESVWM
jgi:hypothetical protein